MRLVEPVMRGEALRVLAPPGNDIALNTVAVKATLQVTTFTRPLLLRSTIRITFVGICIRSVVSLDRRVNHNATKENRAYWIVGVLGVVGLETR